MIVLDTHILVWWVSGDIRLPRNVAAVIEDAQNKGSEILVSSISAWEVAMLVDKRRLVLSMDVDAWLTAVSAIEGVRFVPVDNRVALASTRLPGEFHKDPADRMIVALARVNSATLLTCDENIISYPHVKTVS